MTIRELRDSTQLTQQGFADRFHLSVDNVRCWEQGVSNPLKCIPWMIERIMELENTLADKEKEVKENIEK